MVATASPKSNDFSDDLDKAEPSGHPIEASGIPRRAPPILPETAVWFAWALSLSLSGLPEAHEQGQLVADRMSKLRKEVEQRTADPSGARDLAYVDAVLAAIESTHRNLTTIVQGRNKNFEEVDGLMETQIEKIRSIDKLTTDAQSALPRIFATGSGLSAPFVVLAFLGISFPPLVMGALGALGASIFYAVYQAFIAPRLKDRVQKVMIDADYRRNLYYVQYLERCHAALTSLFIGALDVYRVVYGESYDERFDDPAEARKAVDMRLGSEALFPRWCPYVHTHYHSDEITPDLWASCESSEGVESCPLYRREESRRRGGLVRGGPSG